MRVYLMAFLLTLIAIGCGGDGAQDRVPLNTPQADQGDPGELPSELQERLNAANAAYRDGEYDRALEYFRQVTHQAPALAVGWYGIGLAQAALGNSEAADSAMMEVHRLAPELPLQHPGTSAPTNPHMSPPPRSGGEGSRGGYDGQP